MKCFILIEKKRLEKLIKKVHPKLLLVVICLYYNYNSGFCQEHLKKNFWKKFKRKGFNLKN